MKPELREIVARILEIDPETIGDETGVTTEPRWDSLNHMTLLFALEDEFGVQFTDEELPVLTSLAAIEHALAVRNV